MDIDDFLSIVERWAHVDRTTAENATRATLDTLDERLTPARAKSVATWLPPEFLSSFHTTTGPEPLDVDEFLRRVAARENVDLWTAEEHTRAVFVALHKALPADQLKLLAAELPEDLRTYLDNAPVMRADEFINRVARRTSEDLEGAARATVAVLETLAERIAGGDVHDLISRLPVQLHGPLKRGEAATGDMAKRMSLDDFVQRVAEREGITPDQAREHIRAVLATLHDAVDDEYFDVRVQLPPSYASVLPGPEASARRA
jgi:uncharacterized protein (DUF2267 family)